MAAGAHRRPCRPWRRFLELGKEIAADLDALPASDEAWTDQPREREPAERPSQMDPYDGGTEEAAPPTLPAGSEPPAWALDWWADPPAGGTTLRVPTQRGPAVQRVQASIRGRRMRP